MFVVTAELNVPKPSRTIRHSFAMFVKPERDVDEADLAYANCSVEDIARATPFRDAWSAFTRWLAEIQTEHTTSGRPFVVLAHNGAVFDIPVLGFHVEAAGLVWPAQLQFICDSLRLIRQQHMDELRELAAQRTRTVVFVCFGCKEPHHAHMVEQRTRKRQSRPCTC